MYSRLDLFPWLGGMVVKKDHRKEGIGAFMVKVAVQIARELGIKSYFFQRNCFNFYDSFGWEFLCNIPDENRRVLKYIDLIYIGGK